MDTVFYLLDNHYSRSAVIKAIVVKSSAFERGDPTEIHLTFTRRYGPLRGPTSSSCGWLWPSAEAFFALRAKKELIVLFGPIFGNFWCPVVTLVTFSSNISNKKKF